MNLIITNLLLAIVFFLVFYLQCKKWLLPFLEKIVNDWDFEVKKMANTAEKKEALLDTLNNELIAKNEDSRQIEKKMLLWQDFLEKRNVALESSFNIIKNDYVSILKARRKERIKKDSLSLYKKIVEEESLKKVATFSDEQVSKIFVKILQKLDQSSSSKDLSK